MIILSTAVGGDLPEVPEGLVSAALAAYPDLAPRFSVAPAFYGRLNPNPATPIDLDEQQAYYNCCCRFNTEEPVPEDVILVIQDERLGSRRGYLSPQATWYTKQVVGQTSEYTLESLARITAQVDLEWWQGLWAVTQDFFELCGVKHVEAGTNAVWFTTDSEGNPYVCVRVVACQRYAQYEEAVRVTVNTLMEQDRRTLQGARSQDFLRKNPLAQVVMLCDHGHIDEEGAIWIATNDEAPYRVDVRPRAGAAQFTAAERAVWAELFSYDGFEDCPLSGIRALGDHTELHTFQLDFAQSSLEFEIPALGVETAQ